MTKPPAPYLAEPTHGSQIIDSDRRRRIARRAGLHGLQVWSLVLLIAALSGVIAVMGAGLIVWWFA